MPLVCVETDTEHTKKGVKPKPASSKMNSLAESGRRVASSSNIALYHERPFNSVESPQEPGNPPTKYRMRRVSVIAGSRSDDVAFLFL